MASSFPGGGSPQPLPQPSGPSDGRLDPRFVRSRIVIAAAPMVVLSLLIPNFFVLWVPLCAALAVFMCQRRYPEAHFPAGEGARIGLRMAAMGFIVVLVIGCAAILIEHFALHHSVLAEMRQQLQQSLQQSNQDPQTRETVQKMIDGNGLNSLLALGTILTFFLFLALGAAGGAVQALILRKPKA